MTFCFFRTSNPHLCTNILGDNALQWMQGLKGAGCEGEGGLSPLADGCKAPFHPLLKEPKVRGLNNAQTMGPRFCFGGGENQDGEMELDLRFIIIRIYRIRTRQTASPSRRKRGRGFRRTSGVQMEVGLLPKTRHERRRKWWKIMPCDQRLKG